MQGPWAVETACLGMRRFEPTDKAELLEIAQNSEFMRAVRETLAERTVVELAAQHWADSGKPAPVGIALKHTGQMIGVFVALPLQDDPAGPGYEGIFILKSEEYSQGFASEIAQASLDAIQQELFRRNQGKGSQQKPSYSLRGSVSKRCHGAAVLGFKFVMKSPADGL